MTIEHYKYKRTPHLPWSPGADEDDIIIDTVDAFQGIEVVVTEKMDGENTTMYRDKIHARSMDSGYHQSRTWVQNLHGQLKHNFAENFRICGENMFWIHSIVYTALPSYFLMFNCWEDETCVSWDRTVEIARSFNLSLVRVLYRGIFDEEIIKALYDDSMVDTVEGYVVRPTASFTRGQFNKSIAKFVRKDHVQTDQHWLRSGGELNMLRIPKSKQ